jgi:hypothetical protein
MIRRIIVNLLLTYFIIPLVIVGRTYYMFEFGEGVKYYPGDFESYILDRSIGPMFIVSTLYLIFLFIHNAIILHYREKGKELSLVKKIGVLWAIHLAFVLFIGSFSNIWGNPIWSNWVYLPMTLIPSVVFASAIHFLVDLPDIRKLDNMVGKN